MEGLYSRNAFNQHTNGTLEGSADRVLKLCRLHAVAAEMRGVSCTQTVGIAKCYRPMTDRTWASLHTEAKKIVSHSTTHKLNET